MPAGMILSLILALASAAVESPIASPADLWRGLDPRTDPLEITVEKSWDERDLHYEKFRFTAETVGAGKVRVLAMIGFPLGAKRAPALLHVHGGGQTLSK